ncbi:MFS transporter [Thermophilibacter sp.]
MTLLARLRALPPMAVRLVLMRLFVYLGVQCAYFIGVVGTLTYALDGGVGDNALGVALLNLFLIAGSNVGGTLLDRVGPRRYFALVVAVLVGAAVVFTPLSGSVEGVLVGASLLGFGIGMADLVAKAFPAYLTDDAGELQRVNAVIYTVSNVAIVVGPLLGGALAAAFSTSAVFWLLGVCAALSVVPALGFRPVRDARTERPGRDDGDGNAALSAGFSTVFATPALTLLFWTCFLSFFGYGAFDPLESLYYRDVLHVGVEWMGWLSAAAGVGGVVGSLAAMRLPARHATVRTLLALLFAQGAGCALYVATPWVGVACVGQVVLGCAFGMLMPLNSTLVQTHAPLDAIGRVNAVMLFGNNIAGVVPLLAAPTLARALGVQGALLAASALVALTPVGIALVRRDEVRALADEERRASEGAASRGPASREG